MKVYLYVLNTLADWEIGLLLAELNSRRFFKDKSVDLEVMKIGNSEKPIKTMGGIEIKPDLRLDAVDFLKDDLLVLPGADTWMEEEHREILDMSKQRIEDGCRVAAICGGTIGLAKVGALDKKKHTSNDKNFLKMVCPEYKGEALYEESPAVFDRNLITASGLAPIEFTCEIIRDLGLFDKDALEAWFNLFRKRESKYFFDLMKAVQG